MTLLFSINALSSKVAERFGSAHIGGVLAKNSFLLLSDRLVATALNLVFFAVAARVYGPAEMGRWSYALIAIQMMAPLLASGLEPVTVRALVLEANDRRAIIGSSFFFLTVTTLIATGLSTIWLYIDSNDPAVLALGFVFALATIPNCFFVFEHELKARLRVAPVVLIHIGVVSLGAVSRITLALNGAPLIWLAWIYVAEACLVALLLSIAVGGDRSISQGLRVVGARLMEIIRLASPLIMSGLVVAIFFRLNYFFLEGISDFREVGLFAFAASVVQAGALVPSSIATAIFPMLVTDDADGLARSKARIQMIIYLFTLMGYAGFLMATVMAQFVPALFGPAYAPAEIVLVVLSATLVPTFVGAARALMINVVASPGCHLISALVGVSVLVLISPPLITAYGAIGASIAQVIAYFCSVYLTTPFFPSLRGLWRVQLASLLLIPPSFVSENKVKDVSKLR